MNSKAYIRWTTPEQVMEKIHRRNRRIRIINNSLFVKVRGSSDPVYCFDSDAGEIVVIRKADWVKASPAFSIAEGAVLLRISYDMFEKYRDLAGVTPKQTNTEAQVEGLPTQKRRFFYSLEDLIEISRNATFSKKYDVAGESEIRRMFSTGFVAYKKTKDGDFVPVWDETIY